MAGFMDDEEMSLLKYEWKYPFCGTLIAAAPETPGKTPHRANIQQRGRIKAATSPMKPFSPEPKGSFPSARLRGLNWPPAFVI
jgi:hypothetical protein